MPRGKSLRNAANEIGVSHVAVSKWLRRPDCPVRHGPPFSDADIQALKQFRSKLEPDRAAEAESNPDLHSAYKKIQILLSKERMEHEKLKREILAGQKIDRTLLDSSLGGLASVFVSVLDDLELTLPPRFGGRTTAQIERELGPILDACRRRIVEKAQYELLAVEKLAQQVAARVSARGRGRPAVGST